MWEHRGKVAVVGLGHAPVYRGDDGTPERSLGALGIVSVQRALHDAGLTLQDVDGIAVAAHQFYEGAGRDEGKYEVTPNFLIHRLQSQGLRNVHWTDSGWQVGHAFILAAQAVATGLCRTALVVRATQNPAGVRYGHAGVNSRERVGGPAQFSVPYGFTGPAAAAMVLQRYLWKYRQPREKLATFAVHNRRQGLQYEHSIWAQRGEVLTEEQYLNARMVAAPLCLYDCELPVQTSGAFVVTSAARAKDLRQAPAFVLGQAQVWRRPRAQIPRLDDEEQSVAELARRLWDSAGVGPPDVDLVNVYDGYLLYPPIYTEQLGFCKPGEFLDFIRDGRIEPDGELPLNTAGGNNGAGRMNGVPLLYESVLQLQGRAGTRQVADCNLAVTTIGPHWLGQGMVLSSSPRP